MLKNTNYDKGYILFNILCKSIYDDYLFFQFINYLFEIIILHFFFYRFTPKYYILSFMFYFVFFGGLNYSMIYIRNSKAVMLFLLSIQYIENKKPIKYFLLNLLGLLFHFSAIFYFPLYFFINKKSNDIFILLLYLFGLCFFLLQLPIIKTILILLSRYMYNGQYNITITNYLNSSVYSKPWGIHIGFIERTFTFFFVFYFRNKLRVNNNIFLNCFFIYSFISVWFSDFNIFFDRVGNLFVFSYWVLYPNIYSFLHRKYKAIFLCLFLSYSLIKIFTVTFNNPTYKYENIFTNVIDRNERHKFTKSCLKFIYNNN